MANRHEAGPSGKLDLCYESSESGSGHREMTFEASLSPGEGKTVLLTLERSDSNAIKGTRELTSDVW